MLETGGGAAGTAGIVVAGLANVGSTSQVGWPVISVGGGGYHHSLGAGEIIQIPGFSPSGVWLNNSTHPRKKHRTQRFHSLPSFHFLPETISTHKT